jgi:hypothetical protein
MPINSEETPPMTGDHARVVITLPPQLALDVAISVLLVEHEQLDPLTDLVTLGVEVCDAVYDSGVTVGPVEAASWSVEVSESVTAAAEPAISARERSLRVELDAALQENAKMRAELEQLTLSMREPLAAAALRSSQAAQISAFLAAHDDADAQTSAVVAEAVQITKVAVTSAAGIRIATAEALRGANTLSTVVAAEAVAEKAAQTAAGVQASADAAASLASSAAADSAAQLAAVVTATAVAAAGETASAALLVSRAVAAAASQASLVRRSGEETGSGSSDQLAATAAEAAVAVQVQADEAAVRVADAASDAAVRVSATVGATATITATETTLAALAVSRAVALAAARAATTASEAAIALEGEVGQAASAVQAIASATARQETIHAEARALLGALVR